MIRVGLIGYRGKMGSVLVDAIAETDDLELVCKVDMDDDLGSMLDQHKPDVVVDFTRPDAVYTHTQACLERGIYVVVGTTGLSVSQMDTLSQIAIDKGVAMAVCPNFSIGVILMMKAAQEFSKYMNRVEIIEMHHDKKVESPSGTAIKTAKMLAEANPAINEGMTKGDEFIECARGGIHQRIPIHSVRLPGYIASEEILFGGLGQFLTLRHDTTSREAFMPGILLAIRQVQSRTGLIYGLEHFID